MKTRLLASLSLLFVAGLRADVPASAPIAPAASEATDTTKLTDEQLEQLLGPIALYPDALIALILPAATAPADVVLAARYLKDNGDPAEVSSRSWDESVKSLVHYAEVVKWMDDNLSWTKQVGEAFREQPAEVMQAIQRLRAKARAAGTLVDSAQQQVVMDSDVISIIPAQPNTIYVPYYDPVVVYAPPPNYYPSASFISFSAPFAVGAWLRFDCDWRQRTVWTVDRHWAARDHHDWRHPVFPGQPGYVNDPNRHPWRPSNYSPRFPVVNTFRRDDIARPSIINAPQPVVTQYNNPPARRREIVAPAIQNGVNARDPYYVGPVTSAVPLPPARGTNPPTTIAEPPRRFEHDRPNRAIAFQNPPAAAPVMNQPAALTAAPAPTSRYPFGNGPASPIVPAFTGPVVPAMPAHVASQPPQIRMPAAASAPAAPPPQPAPQSDNKRGVNDGGDQRKQLN